MFRTGISYFKLFKMYKSLFVVISLLQYKGTYLVGETVKHFEAPVVGSAVRAESEQPVGVQPRFNCAVSDRVGNPATHGHE
jgi:hypothetical protein